MSEDSKGLVVKQESLIKPEPEAPVIENVENIPIVDAIDIENAVVIMPENTDGDISLENVNEGSVVVVASVSSSGELITSDGEPIVEALQAAEVSTLQEEVAVQEPKDPNTCTHCNKVFKSQTGMKRHLLVCQPEPQEEMDDPLAFEICNCCGEPVDTAHKVS